MMAPLQADTEICLIFDYPHHYRAEFLEQLSQHARLTVLFTSAKMAEREGLDNHLSHRLRYQFLSDRTFDDVAANPWQSLKTCVRAARTLCSMRPAILIVHGYFNPACWAAPLLKWWLNCKLVIWGESNYFDKKRFAWAETLKRGFFKAADQCHVYGRSAAQYFRSFGIKANRVVITQPTVLERVFRQRRKSSLEVGTRPRRLIYAGRFSPEKNVLALVRAFRRHIERNPGSPLSLTLVGFGDQERELRALCANQEWGRRISVVGRVQQEELAGILAEHDVLVLPSVREAYGLVVLEAMFIGLPAIVSERCGCAADLVTDSTGWLVNPDDVESIAQALDEVSRCSAEDYAGMRRSSIEMAESFSTERSIELTMQALAKFL